MTTAIVCVVGPVLVVLLDRFAKWLAYSGPKDDITSCRPVDPQCGAVDGTGVERTPSASGDAQVPAALPRSPLAPVAEDPRPSATGPKLPAAAAPAPVAVAGVQHRTRRPVVIHDW